MTASDNGALTGRDDPKDEPRGEAAQEGDPADRPFCPACDLNVNACTCEFEHEVWAERDRLAGALREVGERLDWIERDRREPDKVLCAVQSARGVILRADPPGPSLGSSAEGP